MIELVIGSLLGGIFTSIGLGVLVFYLLRTAKFNVIIEDFLSELAVNEGLQKNLYTLGALVGNGAASGAGLQKRSGKFGWNDIIMQIAANYLGKMIPQGAIEAEGQMLDRFGNPTRKEP